MKTVLPILLLAFSSYYLFVILFLLNGLRRLKNGSGTAQNSFSVIIAARNEEKNIEACLRSVFSQDYPLSLFEVIVIDDRSADRTPQILKKLKTEFPGLEIVTITECPPGLSPKKHALSRAIERAKNDILLFTDADCVVPQTWISAINRHFDESTGAVSGPTGYFRPDGMNRLFWGLQAMDFFSHGVVAAAATGTGLPLNTNANNFAVRRAAYDAAQGYSKVKGVVSGDDDLLMQAVARRGGFRVRYAIEKEAAVFTAPTADLKGVWEQRKRWGSKTVYYNTAGAFFLAGVFIYYFLILMGLVFSPCHALAAFCFKTLLDFILAFQGMRLFGRTDLLPYFFPAAVIHIPLVVLSVFAGVFGRFTWKGATTGKKA